MASLDLAISLRVKGLFSELSLLGFQQNFDFSFCLVQLGIAELGDLHSLLKKYIVRHSERPIEKAPYLKEVITTYEISDECSSIEGDYLHGKVSIPSYEIHSKIHPQKIVFKKKDLPLIEKKKKLPTKSQFSCPIGSGLPFSINDPRLESTYNLSKTKTDWNLHEKENLDYARPFDIYKFCINPL